MQGWKVNEERDETYVNSKEEVEWLYQNVFLPDETLHNEVGFRGVLISSLKYFKYD